MASMRVYVKKQIQIDKMNFRQSAMFKIGGVGVAAVKNRVSAALGPDGSSAKPLTKNYAIRKSKRGLGNRRNLISTGDMLRNFMVRTVSDNKSSASNSTRKNRIKAAANAKIEPWILFSPRNKQAVREAARRVMNEMTPRLLLSRFLGAK